MSEQWKDIPGYEGRYQVSDHGRVLSVARKVLQRRADGNRHRSVPERVLTPFPEKDGYLCVSLASQPKRIHTLVLLAFVGPRPVGAEVAHGNGRKTDNRLSNLRYATQQENAADRDLHGTTARGATHIRAKLGEKAVRHIRAMRGRILQKHLAQMHGISQSQVSAIQLGASWSSVA